MAVVTGNTLFFIPAGQTWGFTSAINGDTTSGGDYVGPLVAVGIPSHLRQEVTITPTNARILSRDENGLTSRTVYDYSVSNNNAFGVTIRLDKFFDG
jgi:hypothetical protein